MIYTKQLMVSFNTLPKSISMLDLDLVKSLTELKLFFEITKCEISIQGIQGLSVAT